MRLCGDTPGLQNGNWGTSMDASACVELVSVTTHDRVTLHGAIARPIENDLERTDEAPPIDAVICWHGVGGNFYSGRLFPALRQSLDSQGIAFLYANTRGHDLMYTALAGGKLKRLGAAFEIVDECRHDFNAWVDWLSERGYRRIGILGHSLGAIKAIYAQAAEQRPEVQRLISLSAPSLTQRRLLGSEMGGQFREDCERAIAMIEAGLPTDLFEARAPFPLPIAPFAHQDKYGPEDRYDILRALPKLELPTLLLYGSLELASPNGAFLNLPEEINSLTNAVEYLTVEVLPGADHFYSGKSAEVAERIRHWLFETIHD